MGNVLQIIFIIETFALQIILQYAVGNLFHVKLLWVNP